jgi:hypothetical protein
MRCLLHGHGQPTAQGHTPERLGRFAPTDPDESVKCFAEVDDRRHALGLAPFGIIQAPLNGCCAGFILEPREPGEGIKTEPSVSLHADVPRYGRSARWYPSPTLGALAIRIRAVIAALA